MFSYNWSFVMNNFSDYWRIMMNWSLLMLILMIDVLCFIFFIVMLIYNNSFSVFFFNWFMVFLFVFSNFLYFCLVVLNVNFMFNWIIKNLLWMIFVNRLFMYWYSIVFVSIMIVYFINLFFSFFNWFFLLNLVLDFYFLFHYNNWFLFWSFFLV
jgi:hypothetical protein